MKQQAPPSPAGNILQSASNVAITGGSFVAGSQYNVTTTVNDEPNKRLELLYGQVAPNAILNAGGRADEVKCFPGTREEVLAKIEAWIDAKELNHERRIFWLSGPAGAGKSAIVQTLAERCMARGVPMVNFFFFRADVTRNHARPIVATLLYQLFNSHPTLKPLVGTVLAEKPLVLNQALADQFEYLIKDPVHSLIKLSALCDQFEHSINNPVRTIIHPPVHQWPMVILIDGLDECDSARKHDQQILLRVLHRLVSYENSPFIVLVASRPEPHLTMTFNEVGSCAESIFLNKDYRPSDDIRLFVVAELARIKKTHHLGRALAAYWPSEDSINSIVDKSSGQFIYAATVLRFIANSSTSPAHSLDKVLGLRPVTKSNPFTQLDAIYTYILSQVEDWEATRDLLGAHLLIQEIGTAIGLNRALRPLGHEADDLPSYVSDLVAIVRFNHERSQLEFYHASLSDFLCDSTRSGVYHIDLTAFTERAAVAHIKGIRDKTSLLVSLLIVWRVRQITPSINEALTSYPPEFRLRSNFSTLEVSSFIINPFLKHLHHLYFLEDNQLYQLALRNWFTWFRNIGAVFHDRDLKDVELADMIWQEITASQVNTVIIETDSRA
ncbi:hypothetical protein D9619_004408 [Psilocybe cf. subviscida]|uniref:NACHT domain-containing protein n=1 Tax=Psilocybe cf. subviscida TaxID=2480587 RepID=A0A8H5BQI7_9AGAR|nr:hypothetical protein D9619_004408 [Psilocybe cf. subviscida]